MLVCECFRSLQGEGVNTGHPSVFVRLFGCNLRCRGFGCFPELSYEPEQIAKDLDKYEKLSDLPVVKFGCDSYPASNPKFKKFSTSFDCVQMKNLIKSVGKQGDELVWTGGEPLLPNHQREIVGLYKDDFTFWCSFKIVTFETNGTQVLLPEFEELVKKLQSHNISVIFSVSPKLSCSGEKFEKAINIEAMEQYYNASPSTYLKFVVVGDSDITEVNNIVTLLNGRGVHLDVYLMPEGGDSESYFGHRNFVANIALRCGYYYSQRCHIDIWKNDWSK